MTIIWDLDGTLLDSLQDLADATNYALRSHSLPERSLDEVRQFVGNGVRKLIERAVGEAEDIDFEAIFADFRTYYADHCNDRTRPYPDIIETLQELHRRGVRMAIVSNKLQSAVTELHRLWFADIIEVAVGERPDIPRKPAPDLVRLALEELDRSHPLTWGTNPPSLPSAEEVIYIGDSEVDILTARAAGLTCLSALWGFRSEDFLLQHGTQHLLATPVQLLNYQLPILN